MTDGEASKKEIENCCNGRKEAENGGNDNYELLKVAKEIRALAYMWYFVWIVGFIADTIKSIFS